MLSHRLSRYSRFIMALCTTLLLPGAASSSMHGAEITETVLDNGLRVVMRPVKTNPVICSAVLVRAGVAWEPEGMSGASHFLEHLLFNGTASRTQEQLYADIDDMGAYNNATTRDDHTLFLLLAPEKHLDRALQIQADMLLHSTLPPDKFEKEKGIVLAEMARDDNDPAHLADVFFTGQLHAGSPYARPVLGTVESISGLQRRDVLEYYRQRYVPRRMVLLLTGDFDPEDALERINHYFGGSGENTGTALPDQALPPASPAFADGVTLTRHNIEAGRTYLQAAFPAPDAGDPDATAFGLLTDILSGPASALEKALKSGENPAVYQYSLSYGTTGGKGILGFSAALTGARSAEEVLSSTVETLIQATRPGAIDPVQLRALHQKKRTEDATLKEQIHYDAMFRAPRLLQSAAADLALERTRRQDVPVAVFSRLMDSAMNPMQAVATVSGPDEEDGQKTTLLLTGLNRDAISPDQPASAGGEPLVEALENGLTVSLRVDPSHDVFAIHLLARNRSALEPVDHPGLADLVHRLLLRGSLARGASALEEELAGIGASTKFHDDPRFPFDDYRTTPAYSFATMESRTEHALAALRLFAEMIQTPRFDPMEIERTVGEMQDLARRNTESSRSTAGQKFMQLIAPGHPLSRPVSGTPESLSGINRAQVLDMHQRLMTPANLILSIRGGGEPQVLMSRIREIFGGTGAGGGFALTGVTENATPTEPAPPPPLAQPQKQAARHEETLGKRQSHVRMGAMVQVPESRRPALAVAVMVLSERLQMDLRETRGLAYSIGASLTPMGGDHELLSVSVGTDPAQVEQAETAIHQVTDQLKSQPAGAGEIQRIVAARAGRILMRRLPSQNQAMYDGLMLFRQRPTSGNLLFLEAISTVTPDQVAAAAEQFIHPGDWAVVIVR